MRPAKRPNCERDQMVMSAVSHRNLYTRTNTYKTTLYRYPKSKITTNQMSLANENIHHAQERQQNQKKPRKQNHTNISQQTKNATNLSN